MTDSSSHPYSFPECPVEAGVQSRDVLTQVLRNGAQDMLARAVLDEVAMYVAERADLVDEQGHHLVVRNGYLPQRKIMPASEPSRFSSLECVTAGRWLSERSSP